MMMGDTGFQVYWTDLLFGEIKEISLNGLKEYLE